MILSMQLCTSREFVEIWAPSTVKKAMNVAVYVRLDIECPFLHFALGLEA